METTVQPDVEVTVYALISALANWQHEHPLDVLSKATYCYWRDIYLTSTPAQQGILEAKLLSHRAMILAGMTSGWTLTDLIRRQDD